MMTTKRQCIYDILNPNTNTSQSEIYWEGKYGPIDWKQMYNMLWCTNVDRKIIDFQWKCINGAVMTEQRLMRFSNSTGICLLCGIEQENLSHILIDCDSQGDFWKEVIQCVRRNVDNYIFKEMDVMLVNNESHIVNWFFMNAKWIMWKRRCITKFDNVWIGETALIKWYKTVLADKCKVGRLSKCSKKSNFFENIEIA